MSLRFKWVGEEAQGEGALKVLCDTTHLNIVIVVALIAVLCSMARRLVSLGRRKEPL